jgi:sugar/nucleoside kinase (ribokinase family)
MIKGRVSVFGPAYLDRVMHVDGPLIDPAQGPPLDQSVEGVWKFGPEDELALVDPGGYAVSIGLPSDWPGPSGEIQLSRPVGPDGLGSRRVEASSWHDDLGGMGAGFAAALGGMLWSALGPANDAMSQAIAQRLARHGIVHCPLRVLDQSADWTLLISSGHFGDKLPIGFRGCHERLDVRSLVEAAGQPCELRVVASLPNRLAGPVLSAPGARVRLFAPAMRNVLDHDCSIASFAPAIDILCCNRGEWEALGDQNDVAWLVSILAITDGGAGSLIRFTAPNGEPGRIRVPAFARQEPPRDTNRAGEAYAATLVATLLEHGWNAESGVVEEDLIAMAANRASAAAALELDMMEFGFPSSEQIDAAIRAGCAG